MTTFCNSVAVVTMVSFFIAMTKSAHDLIMEVNDKAFARGTSENSTEDQIIKINQGKQALWLLSCNCLAFNCASVASAYY